MPLLYTFTVLFGVHFAALHYLAEKFELYWRYDWLDVPMHVLGGVFVVLALASLQRIKILPAGSLKWTIVFLTMTLLLWEAFGVYRYGGLKPDFFSDGIVDLLCGTVGIGLGFILTKALNKIAA